MHGDPDLTEDALLPERGSEQPGVETLRLRGAVAARLFEGDEEPVRIGRFVIVELLGRGGMGVVYKAYDPELDRRVAVKLFIAPGGGGHDERAARMMVREARALARLNHPNVVTIHEVGVADGRLFIAMEFVDGGTLRDRCAAVPVGDPGRVAMVLAFAEQAAAGLQAAHAAGLVHRDLKPTNLLVDRGDRLRVADFGVARAVGSSSEDEPVSVGASLVPDTAPEDRLTSTGALVGTPAYMAPEQMGGSVTALSDQFSWAVTFWEALYGEHPFEGSTPMALLAAIDAGEIRTPPAGAAVPSSVRQALERALSADPAQRFADMDAARAAIVVRRRRSRWPWLLAAGLGGAGVLAATLPGTDPCAEVGQEIGRDWDDAQRERVREALLADEINGPDTWSRTEPRLDEYVQQWSAGRHAVCEAAERDEPPAATQLRIACLEGRRRELRLLVRGLESVRPETVEKVVPALDSLPGIAACEDLEWLQAKVKPPEDPKVRAAADAVEERARQASWALELGDRDAADREIEAALREVEALDHGPTLAGVLETRGSIDIAFDRHDQARADLRRAYFAALSTGADEEAVRVAASLGYHLAEHFGQLDDAMEWIEHAQGLAARTPDPDGRLTPHVEQRRGVVHLRAGRYEEALADLEHAIEHYRAAPSRRMLPVIYAMQSRANALKKLGRIDEALASIDEAAALARTSFGPKHPAVFRMGISRCELLTDLRRLADAGTACRQSFDAIEEVLGRHHTSFAAAAQNLGNLEVLTGEAEAGHGHCVEAARMLEALHGPKSLSVAVARHCVAGALCKLGRLDEGLAEFERVIEIERELDEIDPFNLAITRLSTGSVALQHGQLDRAMVHFDDARPVVEAQLAADHPVRVHLRWITALVQLERGEAEAARSELESLSVLVAEGRPLDPTLASRIQTDLARALVETGGDRERALALARDGLERLKSIRPSTDPDVVGIEQWIEEHSR